MHFHHCGQEHTKDIRPASGSTRVGRGGSWFNPTSGVRTVCRASYEPELTSESVGYRCVVDEP